VVLFVYGYTQSRTTNLWDSGEFIPACASLGVPHPPGNPFYVLFGKFLSVISFGVVSDAVLMNFYSGILAAFAVLFTYLIAVKLGKMMFKKQEDQLYIYSIGVIGALFIAFSNSFWVNAIEAEVYAGVAFFINLSVWLVLVWSEKAKGISNQNILILIVYILFLGFSFQQIVLQIVPAILFVVVFQRVKHVVHSKDFWIKVGIFSFVLLGILLLGYPIGNAIGIPSFSKIAFAVAAFWIMHHYLKDEITLKTWVISVIFILVAFSTHTLLMIRAAQMPYINESCPSTFSAFIDFILRKQYGGSNFMHRNSPLFYQINFHFIRYISEQFFHIPFFAKFLGVSNAFIGFVIKIFILLIGVVGAIFQYKKGKKSFIYFVSFLFMASVAMIIVMNMTDHEVRNREYFFVAAYNFWSVWMAMGLVGIAYILKRRSLLLSRGILALFCLLPVVHFASFYHTHNRAPNYTAIEYAFNYLNSCQENAIIFTNGDNDTFPLWYAQASYDPYVKKQENIQEATDIIRHSETQRRIQKTQKTKDRQRKGIRSDVAVVNLSLLNTPWYIRQMRDKNGIIFGWSDREIQTLRPFRLSDDKDFKLYDENGGILLVTSLKKNQILQVRDIAVIQIIKNNFGKRPIYFAGTTAKNFLFHENFQDEGFVKRVVAKIDEKVALQRTIYNLENVCITKSFQGENFFKDQDVSRISNFVGSIYYNAYMRIIKNSADYILGTKMLNRAITMSSGDYKKSFLRQKKSFEEYQKSLQ